MVNQSINPVLFMSCTLMSKLRHLRTFCHDYYCLRSNFSLPLGILVSSHGRCYRRRRCHDCHDCCRLQMLLGLLLLSDQVPICWRYLLQEACFEWCVSFFLLTSVCKT